MEFFKLNTSIDFMKQRKWAAIFSFVIFIVSIVSIIVNGLNLGLDFTGGTQIEVSYEQAADLTQVRESLNNIGFEDAVVQAFGSSKKVLIRIAPEEGVDQKTIEKKVMGALKGATMQRNDYIGPQVGKELMFNGILAILLSLLFTMVYIALRFEYRFAVSAALALIHDPVLILGIFSFFHIDFDLIALAAILTILGYSLNDTIVVYDRVRENFRSMRKDTVINIMNISINQTLSRTIMTSGLTLLVVLALLIYGGKVLFGFSLALFIGIIIGTYSSIYVAGALAVYMGLERKHLLPVVKHDDVNTI